MFLSSRKINFIRLPKLNEPKKRSNFCFSPHTYKPSFKLLIKWLSVSIVNLRAKASIPMNYEYLQSLRCKAGIIFLFQFFHKYFLCLDLVFHQSLHKSNGAGCECIVPSRKSNRNFCRIWMLASPATLIKWKQTNQMNSNWTKRWIQRVHLNHK